MRFRPLRADEVEVRIQSVKEGRGAILLLYKDARVDAKLLDETVGPDNWQCRFYEAMGTLFCEISIWDNNKNSWVSKADGGDESQTEAIKGRCSDAFKRAGFKWGIGRELYTAPFTWASSQYLNIANGKCFDKFRVTEMEVNEGKITRLSIYNETKKCRCFEYGEPAQKKENIEEFPYYIMEEGK